ncbi:MAG: conjugative transposon protein TraM [Bacteroidota bacterium]
MKMDKKKIVFVSVVVLVIAFIVGYALFIWGDNDDTGNELQTTLVPDLPEDPASFESRKAAVDAIEEKRKRFAPSIYDEKLLDSTGRFDPNLLDKEKQRVVDSIYNLGRIDYTTNGYRNKLAKKTMTKKRESKKPVQKTKGKESMDLSSMALEQQLFFATSPKLKQKNGGTSFYAVVDGEQTVKSNDRLQLRLVNELKLGEVILKQNTRIYGVVKFQPNRLLLEIGGVEHHPFQLSAYDVADGLEGIYIKNSFREDTSREVLNDVVEDVNIPGVPQVRGIKRVFQRSNRNVKVTVRNQYKVLLKAL